MEPPLFRKLFFFGEKGILKHSGIPSLTRFLLPKHFETHDGGSWNIKPGMSDQLNNFGTKDKCGTLDNLLKQINKIL